MPHELFTAHDDGLYTTIMSAKGVPVAYAKSNHYLLAALISAITKNGDSVKDAKTGEYLGGSLDELVEGDAA
jgi:hypothetical protein